MDEKALQALEQHLGRIEADLKKLDDKAASDQLRGVGDKTAALKGENAAVIKSVGDFVRLAQKIKSPNQSDNQTYYGYGTDLYEVDKDPAPQPDTVGKQAEEGVEGLNYDTYQSNSEVATKILDQAEQTASKIDTLVEAGRKFNATRAKADVHAVTSKVAGILRDVDLTQPWVQADLKKLSSRMSQLHGLFFPKA